MRSLTRVSVLMGPPCVGLLGPSGSIQPSRRPAPGLVRSQQWKDHTISKKALQKQGPMPTDHGMSRPRNALNRHYMNACDRTAEP